MGYVASPGGTSAQLVGNFSSLSAMPDSCKDDNLRIFDTCWSEGGYTIASAGGKSAVAELFSSRDYTLHPNYDRLAKKLEHSEVQDELDDCVSSYTSVSVATTKKYVPSDMPA